MATDQIKKIKVKFEDKTYFINDEKLTNDVEFFELFAEVQEDGKEYLVPRLVKHMLVEGEYEKLKENLREKAGNVPVTRFAEFIESAMLQVAKLKNSQAS